mgnify:CR=1 FL=1|jgi:Acetyl/propionyl-CoA carboxylase, alpha subunit
MFDTLLIANRGEIACRIAATARRMGLRTVAVYSDADAQAAHVAACDQAIRIGEAEPRASYLRGDAILAAARAAGAQAIHPGYGFLSENADFARACAEAGIVFVGPPVQAIAAMGDKAAAKALMAQAGVPLVPGYHGEDQDPARLAREADAIGYPVLIKASAGGGGKGMRVVQSPSEFADALQSCKREAAASFGDDRVLIERYLQRPRHIEIQVFADAHGNCIHLFERDCSVQRRHQKVIEEAPAPGMTAERRQAMGQAAVAAARAVSYVGAGTVEFIVEPDGRFYFMEMNTRLQVEHPVTEMITGLDLVEWQLRVAAGEPLPLPQDALRIAGHAIEARIYAENPDSGFLPSTGTLAYLGLPAHTAFANGDVRIDGGVRAGDTISPHYDPMIAKLIVRGADRDEARARMLQALAQTHVAGVHTNAAFLARLMRDEAFATADLDTGLIDRRRDSLLPSPGPAAPETLALAAAGVLAQEDADEQALRPPAQSPWNVRDGWRVGGSYRRELDFLDHDTPRSAVLARCGEHWTLDAGSGPQPFAWQAEPAGTGGRAWRVSLALDGRRIRGTVVLHDEHVHVHADGGHAVLRLHDPLAHSADEDVGHEGDLAAPMPGKIIAIAVQPGQTVSRGQPLLVMEAMKMEHTIAAPTDGVVDEVFYAVGDQVAEGAALVSLQPKAAG